MTSCVSLQDAPLHIAAERGDLEVAKSLLAQGADVNAREVNLKVLALSTLDTLNPLWHGSDFVTI